MFYSNKQFKPCLDKDIVKVYVYTTEEKERPEGEVIEVLKEIKRTL
jgi:hypothetical protein